MKKKLALKALLQPTGYNGGIVGLDRLEGDMRNMNSADKVDDDACHKEKCAENNVSQLMILHGICGVYSDYNSGYRQQTPVMLCLLLLTPWGAHDAAMRTNHSHHYLPNNPIIIVIIIIFLI